MPRCTHSVLNSYSKQLIICSVLVSQYVMCHYLQCVELTAAPISNSTMWPCVTFFELQSVSAPASLHRWHYQVLKYTFVSRSSLNYGSMNITPSTTIWPISDYKGISWHYGTTMKTMTLTSLQKSLTPQLSLRLSPTDCIYITMDSNHIIPSSTINLLHIMTYHLSYHISLISTISLALKFDCNHISNTVSLWLGILMRYVTFVLGQ